MYNKLAGILLSLGLSACTHNNSKQCNSDYDCLETQICESGYCETSTSVTKSPQRTLDQFVTALETGNLDSALTYISDRNKDLYREILSGNANLPTEFQGYGYNKMNLQEIANALKNVIFITPSSEFGNLRDYEYSYQDIQGNTYLCPIRFIQENGNWKIKNF